MSFRRLRAGFLYPALFLLILLIATPCFADFRFAVIGDSRANDEDGINTDVLGGIMEKIKSEDVNFILVTGDMITGSKHSKEHIKRLKKWRMFVDAYGIPVYVIVGNHEIKSESSEDIFKSIFELPENGPADFKELVYSFNYKNAHFVGIDTNRHRNFHEIGETQFNWLGHVLRKNRKKIIFVFGHDPAYPVGHHKSDSLDKFPSQRDHLWYLFREHRVRIYFCGHEHLYNRSIHDGVYQIITGGAGAPLHEKPDKGGFYHFVVVNVKNSGAYDVTVKDIDTTVKDSFSIH